MDGVRVLLSRIASLFRRGKLDAELEEELRAHIELATAENLKSGMAADEARTAALRSFGGVTQTRESYRVQRGLPWMEQVIRDVRFALRQLRKSPGFTLTVVITLALGIGANTAIFTLFDQAMLRMLPVEKPKELVRFHWTGGFDGGASIFGGEAGDYFSYSMYKDLREKNQVFTGILAADRASVGVSWHNQAEDKDAEVVTGNYFQLLGLQPVVGRLFTPRDETVKNANAVAVLSYDYWKTRFNRSRDVIGQTLLVNGQPFEIVGVAPENFDSAIGGYKPGLFLPITMVEAAMPWVAQRDYLNNHKYVWLTLVARLKPGMTQAQAEASLEPLWRSLRTDELRFFHSGSERFKKDFLNTNIRVVDDSRGFSPERLDLRTPLLILMSMAGLLVLMCAINVATLLLLRAAARAREMAMRYALGAKRVRIATQLLVEGGLIGLVGAVAGLALAPTVTTLLVRLLVSADPDEAPYSSAIDARILLFTLGIGLVVSLLFSIAPVLHFLRPDLTESLRQNSGTATKNSQTFRKIAVGVQITLSVILLGGAGLFVRTLDNLRHENVGFETSRLLQFSLNPTNSGYRGDRAARIVTDAIANLERIPGVTSVAANTDPELKGHSHTGNISVQGYKAADGEDMDTEEPYITPGYFATLKQPLLVGREFTEADTKGQPKAAIVNLKFAKRYFGTPQNAIGRQIADGDGNNVKYDITIAGVVGDIKHEDLRTPMAQAMYQPYLQQEHPGGVTVYLRTTQEPKLVESAVRQAIHAQDPTLVVDGLRTMEEQVDRSASDELGLAVLAMGFSALALVMAAVGLYGVLAYSTEQRTREIGVRLALGAQRWRVVSMVLREMLVIAAIAMVVAIPCTIALARLLKSQLYEVTPADPMALAGAAAVMALMVALAATVPARRAASVDPMRALRTE